MSASDGTLRFLAILAAFFGPEPASFYFIEELENGIHPTRLAPLVDLIESQAKRGASRSWPPAIRRSCCNFSVKNLSNTLRSSTGSRTTRMVGSSRIVEIPDAAGHQGTACVGAARFELVRGCLDFAEDAEAEPVVGNQIVIVSRLGIEDSAMNVLVIAEDFVKDELVLQPIIEAMMKAVEWPKAKVKICKIRGSTGRARR